MASTYSDLKIELIGTGEQSGTWGNTTNTNLGTAIEEAITGSADVTFASADVTLTLTDTNTTQTARNLRLRLTGTSGGARTLTVPDIEKYYIIANELADDVTIENSTGSTYTIPAGTIGQVFSTGAGVEAAIDFFSGAVLSSAAVILGGAINATSVGNLSPNSGAFTTLSASGNTTLGTNSSNTLTINSTATTATQSPGDNSTKLATTAYVNDAVTTATGSLGTMATQNANSVNITGGSITGITDLAVADGGTGASSITANSVILGNGSSALSGNLVAPGTSGNVLKSNGTTWTSAAPAISSWNVQNVGTTVASGATGSYTIPANCLMVMGTNYSSMGSNTGSRISVNIKNSGGTVLFTYALTGGNENNGTDGGSGMSSRSAWTIAIPAAAAGGSLEFFRSSGSNNSWNVTVNQYVASA